MIRPLGMVLVVDDDADLRETIAAVLEAEGWKAATASNGLEALVLVQESAPCLLLLDLMMPVLDGWELIKKLKQNAATASIPICAMSASHKPAPGADLVLAKPFDVDQLLNVMRSFCL